MGFTVYRVGDLNNNERMISFYRKEFKNSRILDTGRKQRHYGTKWYRKFVSFRFPGAKRYQRIKAIVAHNYRTNKKKYSTLSQLGKAI